MPGIGSGKDVIYGGSGIQQPRDSGGRWRNGQGVEWVGLEVMNLRNVEHAAEIIDRMRANADNLAAVMEEYMKANAPWTDRTGEARDGLQAVVTHEAAKSTISLGYGAATFYGYFLENYTYSGVSYAIVGPTIDYFSPSIMERITA